MARFASGHEWDIMDITNRRTMERFTRSISAIPDLPPTVPILGQERSVRENIEITGAGLERSWRSRSARMLYRWLLRRGKKGVLPWVKLNGPRSWQLQTALVFLSPYISKAPLLMKRDWLQKPLLKDLSKIDPTY